jgi:DNA polymerase-3 subunit alpha
MSDFVHLHVHSDFSLQDASVSVMALADRAEALGMKYLALTDHGNMFGAMEFLAACEETLNEGGEHVKRKTPIRPIIGCEVYVAPGSRFEKKGSENENKYYHLVLLAANREGYLNLVKLCSFAYTEGFYYRPRVDEELLTRYHGGLIALSACVSGEIPKLIQAGKIEEAERKARYYRDLFGTDNFYLEIQDHRIPPGVLRGSALSERQVYERVVEISRRTGIAPVLTNDTHYLNREDAAAHDVFLCIGTGKLRSEEKRKRYYGDQFYLKSAGEMAALFPECPEAAANTLKIAERCTAEFLVPDKKTGSLEYKFPKVKTDELPQYLPEFVIPAEFSPVPAISEKVTALLGSRKPKKNVPPGLPRYAEKEIPPAVYLWHLASEGLEKRYEKEKAENGGAWEEIQNRAEYELGVIIQMGFTGYFLIVADFINWAKARDISVGPGRGSGAGSIVAYALRITDIDPLEYDLLFERFLNPERISMPDFDVDFCNESRDEVIQYVTAKYGKERVGQIITFGTLGAKAVIKDVARVLGISISESDQITKLIPGGPGVTLVRAFEAESRLRELEADPRYAELFTLARKLEGLNRHSSLHAAGVVIGKSTLHDFVPLYRDPKTGGTATQYTMNHLESCGLVKMDLLGLKTLDVIKHSEELIRGRGGEYAAFSVKTVSETDEATFKMLGEGKSFEIFQFESEGMQNILKQARPSSIKELIALNALYRPGPMENIPKFIDSKWGRRVIEYPDPSLEEVLKETYGVITYQEQVLQVARIVAGFTLGHADELRRAMGKKNMEKMRKEKEKFIAGAVERGYRAKDADRIFELLIPFAGYGFNKSHAAAYSVVAYQTAYLKANFPAEFMAANLSNEIHSTNKDKLSECIGEARKMGLVIDPPDVNRSGRLFTVVEGRIVYGFLGIKGIGDGPAEEIIHARREGGPFTDFMNFLDRVTLKAPPRGEEAERGEGNRVVGKKLIELLIRTGAFDCFGISRSLLMGNLERAFEFARSKKEDRQFGQGSLFENSGEREYPDFEFADFPPWNRMEMLNMEKELLGFYFSGHPLDEYREIWQRAVILDLAHPEYASAGREYTLVGIVKTVRSILTKKGTQMAYVTLEDYNGEIDLTFFPKIWENVRESVVPDRIIILKGKFDQSGRGRGGFLVDALLNKEAVESSSCREIHIRLNTDAAEREESLYPLRDYLFQNSGPCSVFIHVPGSEGETVIRTASQISASSDAGSLDALKDCAAVAEVWRS